MLRHHDKDFSVVNDPDDLLMVAYVTQACSQEGAYGGKAPLEVPKFNSVPP